MAKDKRKYADRAVYLIKAVDKRRKKIRGMALGIRAGSVLFVVIISVFRLLNFIIWILIRKILEFPRKGIREAGSELSKN
ncbi:MAG: hypothetical protein Q7R92_04965 [bacterium]|nr:hypothetical protein [bacterium]